MNYQITTKETAIIVTDPQLAIKANRNANVGFIFYAMGSPIKNKKFHMIIFGCNLYTHVLKEWAIDLIKNCLEENGSILGMLTDGSVQMATPKATPIAELQNFEEPVVEQDKLIKKHQPEINEAEVKKLTTQEKKLARRKTKKKKA